MSVYGVDGIVRILSHLCFIYIAYWGLQSLQLDHLFKKNAVRQVRMTLLFMAIVLGYMTSSFFIEVMTIFRNLTQQFLS